MTTNTINVHQFRTTVDAYNASQTDDNIKHGDVLVAEDQRVVGVLIEAWPVSVTTEVGSFHRLGPDVDVCDIKSSRDNELTYNMRDSFEKARDIAAEYSISTNTHIADGRWCVNTEGGRHPLGWYSYLGKREVAISGMCESCFDLVMHDSYCKHDDNKRGRTTMTECPICDAMDEEM